MRKPRDYDVELKALNARAAQLKQRKVQQLGELVIASCADALPLEILAGALITAAKEMDTATKEGWRKTGVAFFQRAQSDARRGGPNAAASSPGNGATSPPDGGKSAA